MRLGARTFENSVTGGKCTQNLGRAPKYMRNNPLLRPIYNKQSPADNRGFVVDIDDGIA